MNFYEVTFEKDDLFNRKPLADKIVDLISISEDKDMREDSFVIALNASWGNGKTTFVNMLINEIKNSTNGKYNELKAIPIYYNAWEEDDYRNAFESLIYRIIEQIECHKNITPDMKKQLIILKSKLPDVLFSVGKSYVQNKLKKYDIEIEEIIDLVKTNNELKKLSSNDYFEKYQKFKRIKNDFKEILEKLASEKKIIIFIDELDRCRPNFAIETLEIVKHYFNIPNIIFVLSLDIEQLSHSIATCYGQNMDSAGYLRRFIDFQVNMPQAKLDNISFSNIGVDLTKKNFEYFKLSIRDVNKIKKDLIFFFKKFEESEEKTLIYINLIIIKYLYPAELKKILFGTFSTITDKDDEMLKKIILPENMPYFEELINGMNKTKLSEINKVPNENNKKAYFIINKLWDNTTLGEHIERVIEYVKVG